MAESESQASVSHFQSDHCGTVAGPPAQTTTPGSIACAADRASNPRNDLGTFAEQRVPRRPKVSVMLITYNHERYIAQALESVLMQETDFDFKINVIEDCSTDRTQEIVMRYVRQYPDIVKPFFNKKNIGFKVTQRNFYRGFRTLTGEYFAILEGDDYWTSPRKLQKQVDFLDANPDFAICAHNTVKVYDDGAVDPLRFLYWGKRGDATVQDVICLQAFFHTTGVLYRNVFNGNPPRHYRSKWSCDIFVMISHAAFGKVHHIDEDWAVYRAHVGGRFSGMGQMDGWFYNIDGLRRYNAWLGYRYMRIFSESISRYCEHVLRSHGKDGVPPLNPYKFIKIAMIWVCYRSIIHASNLPSTLLGLLSAFRFYVSAFLLYVLTLLSTVRFLHKPLARMASRLATRLRKPLWRTRLSELPLLQESAHWDLIWGLNVAMLEGQRLVDHHPVLQLTAVPARDRAAQHRHALSECISGLALGGTYRVSLWVKSLEGINVQLNLRDSTQPETGIPAHEGEARYDLSSSSVMMTKGLRAAGVEPDMDGWRKVSADIATEDGKIFVYLGLLRRADNCHVFKGDGEQLLFGGIEISRKPLVYCA
jgi:glycosyltransferase involved in cell wall biosynthesis